MPAAAIRRRLSLLLCLGAAACTTTFDPDRDDLVTGSETYATPFAVDGKGAVRVHMRRGQVGEHAGGVHRAWRVETTAGEPLTPWLTTTPLVDLRDQPQLRVTTSGVVFAFDPGEPIDSRDRQAHLAKGWYRVGARGVTGEPFDEVVMLPGGGYETIRADGDTESLRVHGADGAQLGERTLQKGSARLIGSERRRLVTRPDGTVVLIDATLRDLGRIVAQAAEPGEWVDLAAVAPQVWSQPLLFGLGRDRELVCGTGEPVPGPWQRVLPLGSGGFAALALMQTDNRLTLLEPTVHGPRLLMRDATFAIAQSRMVPKQYADVGWGEQSPVLLAGQRTAAGDGYVLFAQIEGLLRGPFAAPTSEAATAAMWAQLAPVATARREANERSRAAAAAAVAAAAATLQRSVDANQARLDAIDREQIAYFEALKAGDLAAAGRAIAAMERQLDGFFVPQGHARTEAMRAQRAQGDIYFLDWELRRPDRSLERLAERAPGFFFQGGGLYERYCSEASRLLLGHEAQLARTAYDRLFESSYGFPEAGKQALAWHRARIERSEAQARYDAHMAAGRFDDAHGMAYQLGFEGWVEHLQTRAKGRVPDAELEALLRAAVDRAPSAELKAKLQAAHHSQWLDMVAAQQREQRERFRQLDEQMQRDRVAAELAARERWAAYKLEAQRRGFLWTGN